MARPRQQISLTEAADRLGVHYMTAYRYVRTGRLPATKAGHEWQVDEADVARLLAQPPPGRRRRGADPGGRADRLVERLLAADEAGAWTLVEDALASGLGPDEAYLRMLAPALTTVGARWERGEITVADEHRASVVVGRLVGRLGPRFSRPGRRRGTVVLGTAPGEHHGLPTALLRDLLRGRGFDVVDLGADVPVTSWSATATATAGLVAVGLCATRPGNDEQVRAAIAALRAATDVPVVLGGMAVEGPDHAAELGASAFSGSFEEALARFDAAVGGGPARGRI